MIAEKELLCMLAFLAVFSLITGLGLLMFCVVYGDSRRAIIRLRSWAAGSQVAPSRPAGGHVFSTYLASIGSVLLPRKKDKLALLKQRLVLAGFYDPHAAKLLLGIQLVGLVLVALTFALAPYALAVVTPLQAVLCGIFGGCVGFLGPSLWLQLHKRGRQRALRRALPDALDMLVLCVEGGVSLVAAIHRVASELHMIHPVLAVEMSIVQRAVELGMTPGEALKKFSERCGMAEVGNLASVMMQSDRFGASVSNALRIFAEEWRVERQQKAEEMAQKAAVKILFPMLLCIFPAVFLVLLGPAAFQIVNIFNGNPR